MNQAAAEQKKKDDAAALVAAQEAEKLRLREEELRRERQALEDQKAEILAREAADKERKYLSDWYDAIEINKTFIPESAILMNIKFDEAVLEEEKSAKARLKADLARAKLVEEDKESLIKIADIFDQFISNIEFQAFKTDEACKMAVCLAGTLKSVIHGFDKSARELV